jgi:hypothetical protein
MKFVKGPDPLFSVSKVYSYSNLSKKVDIGRTEDLEWLIVEWLPLGGFF